MSTRQYYFVRATGEATTTATAFVSFATLNFTPDDNSNYAMFWTAQGRHNLDTAADLVIDFRNNASSATIQAINHEPQDQTSYFGYGGLGLATLATATGEWSLDLRFAGETATSSNNVQNGTITVLKLIEADQFRESLADFVPTATVYTVAATFSFTPSATGNYQIFAAADFRPNQTAGAGCLIKLTGGTSTALFEYLLVEQDVNNFRPWGGIQQFSMTASQWDFTVEVQKAAATGLDPTIRNIRFLALRESGFELVDYAAQATEITSTTTSSATVLILSATTAARDHLVLGVEGHNPGSNAIDIITNFIEDGTAQVTANEEPQTSIHIPGFAGYAKTMGAGTHEFRYGFLQETATGTGSMVNSRIVLLDLHGVSATATAVTATGRRTRLLMMGVGH